MSASAANWSQLGDVLDLIIHKLDLVDFLHFSATCRSWHSCAQTHRKCCRVCPKTLNPWVLFTIPFNREQGIENHHLNLYDIANKKSYNISIPDSFFYVLGSSNGFLVVVDAACDLHVINPLTGSHYPLPPISSILSNFGSDYGLIDKAVIKVCPCSHKPLFVLGIHDNILIFIKVGDISWTRLNYGMDDYIVDDAVFWKGKLHVVGESGTYVFDLDRLLDRPTYLAGEYACNGWNYLVESPNGDDLFLVVRELWEAEWWVVKGFIIFKFDEGRGRWYNVKDIGDLALFVGPEGGNCSFVNPTSQSPNVVAKNNICFTDEYDSGGVGVLDLNDGSIRRFNLPIDLSQFMEEALWFMPLCN